MSLSKPTKFNIKPNKYVNKPDCKLNIAMLIIISILVAQVNPVFNNYHNKSFSRIENYKNPITNLTEDDDSSLPIAYHSIVHNMAATNKGNQITNGNQPKGIKIISWNKGSAFLINRIDTIKQMIHDRMPHVLALQEANIRQEDDLNLLQIPNYSLHTDGLFEAGNTARTCVFVHNDLTVTPRPDLQHPDISMVSLTIGKPRQKKFNLLSFYRQWGVIDADHQTRIQSMTIPSQTARYKEIINIWEKSINEGRETITLSDSNLSTPLLLDEPGLSPYDASHKPISKQFTNRILPLGVTIINDQPTYFPQGKAPTSIDHVTSTNPNQISNMSNIVHGESQHKILSFTRLTKAPISPPRYKQVRDYRNIEPLEFQNLLWSSHSLKEACINTDPNVTANLIIGSLTEALDTVAPLKRIQIKSNNVPYLSNRTRSIQFERDQVLIRAREHNNPDDWRLYRTLRNQATQSIRNDRHVHITNKVSSTYPTTVWQSVKKLTGQIIKGPPSQITYKGLLITSPLKIATSMNEFFIQKIQKIRASIISPPNIDPLDGFRRLVEGKELVDSMSISPISCYCLHKLVKQMKPTKSCGVDGISMKLIKDYWSYLEPAIHNLVTQSILHNTFPTSLKVSKVVPVLKPDSPMGVPQSYRPINLLPGLSKILEKVVFTQISEHLKKYDIITHHHHGGLKGHSPTTSLISTYEYLINESEKGNTSALLVLDQSAAFDICDTKILLNKLKLIGLDHDSLTWIESFLCNRRQVVQIESFLSPELEHPNCSVIQGSVGSGVLYSIYTADLPQAIHPHTPHTPANEVDCPNGTISSFVDDNSLMVSSKSPEETEQIAQTSFNKVSEYLAANKLKLNKSKTKLMTVSKSNNDPKISIIADGEIVQSKPNFLHLGVYLDDRLNWNKFISVLYGQLINRLTSLRILSKYASLKTLRIVATSIICGKIQYSLSLWCGLPEYQQIKIQHILLSAARICLGPKSYRYSTHKLLESMGWLGFPQIAEIASIKLVHQAINTGYPLLISSKINKPLNNNTRASANNDLRLPPYNKVRLKQSFTYQAVNQYNKIPSDLKMTTSKSKFKSMIKQYIKNNRSNYVKRKPNGK